MEKQREKTIILVILVVAGSIGVFLQFNTFFSDKDLFDSMSEIDKLGYIPKFDYIHGFWLMFIGLFFIFLLVFCDFPSFNRIFKVFIKDFKKKFF
jgi:glucan phosphoethanolaminetransferase (alkaline phosphatase superfamily)